MIKRTNHIFYIYRSCYIVHLFFILVLFLDNTWFIKCSNPEGFENDFSKEEFFPVCTPSTSEAEFDFKENKNVDPWLSYTNHHSSNEMNDLLFQSTDDSSSQENTDYTFTLNLKDLCVDPMEDPFINSVEPTMMKVPDDRRNFCEESREKCIIRKRKKKSIDIIKEQKKRVMDSRMQKAMNNSQEPSSYLKILTEGFVDPSSYVNTYPNDFSSLMEPSTSSLMHLQQSSIIHNFEMKLETFMTAMRQFCVSYNMSEELSYLNLPRELDIFERHMSELKSLIEAERNMEHCEINEFFKLLYMNLDHYVKVEDCVSITDFTESQEITELFLLLLIAADNSRLKEAGKALKDRLMRRKKFIIESEADDIALLKYMKFGEGNTLIDIQGGNECARLSYPLLKNIIYILNEQNECYEDQKDFEILNNLSSILTSIKIILYDASLMINKGNKKKYIGLFKQKIYLMSSYYDDLMGVLHTMMNEMEQIRNEVKNINMNDQVFMHFMYKEFNKLILYRLFISCKSVQEGAKLFEAFTRIQKKLTSIFPINSDAFTLYEASSKDNCENAKVNDMIHKIFSFLRWKFMSTTLIDLQKYLQDVLGIIKKMDLGLNEDPLDFMRMKEKLHISSGLIKALLNFIKILCNARCKRIIMTMNKVELLNRKVQELRDIGIDVYEQRIPEKDRSSVIKIITEIQLLYSCLFELLSVK